MILTCKDRAEWLEARKKLVTASDVAAILGWDPFRSALDVYVQKKTGYVQDETDAMLMGHAFEPGIAKLYELKTGRHVEDPGDFTIFISDENPMIGATLDRITWKEDEIDSDGFMVGIVSSHGSPLELKHVGWPMRSYWQDGCPLHVEIQNQIQQYCSGAQWGAFCGVVGGSEIHYGDIDRSDTFIADGIHAIEEFKWRLNNDRPPMVTHPRDLAPIKRLYSAEDGETVSLGPDALKKANRWEQAKADAAASFDEKSLREAELRAMMKDASFGVLNDGTMLVRKTTKDGKETLRRVRA